MNNNTNPNFVTMLGELDHFISLETAVTMVKNFETNKRQLDPNTDPGVIPISETFNVNDIATLIQQPFVVALRIYSGLDSNTKIRFILVGVEADGLDVIQKRIADPKFVPTQSELIIDQGQRLP